MIHPVKVSDLFVTPWLAQLAAGSPYMALMTADPYAVSDPLTVELVGSVRAPVAWLQQSRYLVPAYDLVFTAVPTGVTVLALAGFSASFNGNMAWAMLVTPFTTPSYSTLVVSAADLKVGFGPKV